MPITKEFELVRSSCAFVVKLVYPLTSLFNSQNFIKPVIAQVPWPTPVGIGAFLGTADLRAVLVALVCAFAAFLVYLPFIRVYDQKLVKEEQGI